MASYAHSTPQVRPHLARINPTWQPAEYPLGAIAPFFNGRGSAPATVCPSPIRPAPEMAVSA